MDTDVDRSRSQTASRFGKLSKNMFFARHVPHPKFLKFITGTAGLQVCHVRDNVPHLPAHPSGDLAKTLLSDPRFTIEFPPNSYNEALLRSYADKIQLKKRRERFLPPLPGWNPSGAIVEDTENWRRELTRIAETVGLLTAEELADVESKKETRTKTPSSPLKRSLSTSSRNGEYSNRTGRWNETPRAISRSRSVHRRTPLSAIIPNHLFCVDEQERETWMLQVLCQILKTEDINEIQSWLVSSNSSEKDAVRQLISSAIKGLEEGGRIQPTAYFDDTVKSTQVNMDALGSLLSHKFPNVPSDLPLPMINESTPKIAPRPRTSPQVVPPPADSQSKATRAYQSNLDPIDEETHAKGNVPQPTKVDIKRDIQVLTLNDDGNNPQSKNSGGQDEVPF